jgi:hypothetical protein
MSSPRLTIILSGIFLSASAAVAADEWKTVTLGDDGSKLDVPAAAKVDGPDPATNSLAFFSVTAGLNGDAWCGVTRMDYPKGETAAQYAPGLTTPQREMFCKQDSPTVKDWRVLKSTSFAHNGVQAATCAASFTDTAAKAQGQVQNQMILAAPRALYFLSCTVEAEDQFDAEGNWTTFWAEKFEYMQKSLRLPQ